MNEDNIILLAAYLLHWSTLSVLGIKSKNRKQTIFVNAAIQIIYSVYFFYGLIYKSRYGSGLVWWSFLIGYNWNSLAH
jgi:hypothetical protein